MLDSGTDIDLVVRIAVWVGRGAALTTLLLISIVLLLRWLHRIDRDVRRRVADIWRPVLTRAVLGGDPEFDVDLPQLARREHEHIAREWLTMHAAVTGDGAERLATIARHIGLMPIARRIRRGRSLHRRLLGTELLGRLGDSESWDEIAADLGAKNTLVSLVAADALAHIDRRRALDLILSRSLTRHDWPTGRLAAMLQHIGLDLATERLLAAILLAPPERRGNLLPLLRLVEAGDVSRMLRHFLAERCDVAAIAACLNACRHPDDLALVRELAASPEWPIRLHAVKALGRLGVPEDTDRIVALLKDREWWVRFRAARALARLPWVDSRRLEQIRVEQTDRYAVDILEQIIAERAFT